MLKLHLCIFLLCFRIIEIALIGNYLNHQAIDITHPLGWKGIQYETKTFWRPSARYAR